MTILNSMKTAESSNKPEENTVGKGEIARKKQFLTSYFSFSRSVFKILIQQTRKNQSLFGKGLNH